MRFPLLRKILLIEQLPVATRLYSLAASVASKPIEVPFEFYHDSVIVQVKVDGKGPFTMLVDTGVNPSMIDRATAEEIELKLSAHGQQGSGGGTETNLSYETSLPEVSLGELRAGPVEALAIDLTVDYQQKLITLERPNQSMLRTGDFL
jgi:hypothetical protein